MIEAPEPRPSQVDGASARIQLLAASGIIWMVNFAILTTRSIINDPAGWPSALPTRLTLTGICLLLCYGMHLAFSKIRASIGGQLLPAVVLVSASTEFFAWSSVYVATRVMGMRPQPFTGETVVQQGFNLWVFTF